MSGEQLKHINSDSVEEVRYYYNKLFAMSRNIFKGDNASIQVYDTNNWQQIRSIPLPCRCGNTYRHTLHVGSEHITIACPETNTIQIITHMGELVQNIHRGVGNERFDSPCLCHTGSNAVLVAECDRLQLWHDGGWSRHGR